MFVCCNWRSMPAFLRAIGNVEFKACIVWDKTVRIQNLDKFAKQHEFVLYAGPYGGEKTIDVDVWQIPREVQDNHPTAKPTALARRAIKSISGVRVYEPFSGSGTTIIACEQLNRKCYAIEIEPRYIDVAVKRWEKLTGKQATLDGDGRTFAEITAERAA
ncbi:MAG: site-specific DNA-methyltransferase [Phycisphaerae bacterium]|nr:site-specific DNA-methyltransferase [Phycisphaerae bacterium]